MENRLVGGKCGQWKCEEEIGSGCFGCVTGWLNQTTGERLVIKQCKNMLKPENRVRWLKEIELMNSINNKNIVSGKPIPLEITQFIKAPEKLLGLEYCTSDLRKLLNVRNHCCGLPEQTVLNVLRDVSSGMEFLHKKRIIHRDLKPENILRSDQGSEAIFKITDLGYAKVVDASSIANSFVGTMHYLAPELYISMNGYTYTADFWSLGTLIFECITGHRPFSLSGVNNFVDLGRYMERKSDEHICGEYNELEKDVNFFTYIPAPNDMCKPLLRALKKWLQIVLRFNPNSRGDVPIEQSNTSECCKTIRSVLRMRVINVFQVMQCKVLSYEVTKQGDTGSTLKQYISLELDIAVQDQLLLFPDSFLELQEDTSLNHVCTKVVNTLLLYDRSLHSKPCFQGAIEIDKVYELVGKPELKRRVEDLRSYWAQALYYCLKTVGDYGKLLSAQDAFFSYMQRKWDRLSSLNKELERNCIKLEAVIDMFNKSYHCDLAHRPEEHGQAGLDCIQEWETLSQSVNLMSSQASIDTLRKEIAAKEKKLTKLRQQLKTDNEQKVSNELETIARQVGEKYETLKRTIRTNKSHYHDSSKISDLVLACNLKSDAMFNTVYDHLWKLIKFDTGLSSFIEKLDSQINGVTKSISGVLEHQRARQSFTWKLFSTSSPADRSSKSSLSLSSLPDVLQEKLLSIPTANEIGTEDIQKQFNDMLHRLDHIMGRQVEKPKPVLAKKSHTIDGASYVKPSSEKGIRRPSMPIQFDSTLAFENPMEEIKSPGIMSPKRSHLERAPNFEELPPFFREKIFYETNSTQIGANHAVAISPSKQQQQQATFFYQQQQQQQHHQLPVQKTHNPWVTGGKIGAFIEQPPMITNITQGQLTMTSVASPRVSPTQLLPDQHASSPRLKHNSSAYTNSIPASSNPPHKHTLTHTIGTTAKNNFKAVRE